MNIRVKGNIGKCTGRGEILGVDAETVETCEHVISYSLVKYIYIYIYINLYTYIYIYKFIYIYI